MNFSFFFQTGIDEQENIWVNTSDVIDEIFDMCRPEDKGFITIQEIFDSKQVRAEFSAVKIFYTFTI